MSYAIDGIKELRKYLNLSQEKLARELDVTVRTVARWESGGHSMAPNTIAAIIMYADAAAAANAAELLRMALREHIRSYEAVYNSVLKKQPFASTPPKYDKEYFEAMAKLDTLCQVPNKSS